MTFLKLQGKSKFIASDGGMIVNLPLCFTRKKTSNISRLVKLCHELKGGGGKNIAFYGGTILLQQGKGTLYILMKIILQNIYFTVSVIIIILYFVEVLTEPCIICQDEDSVLKISLQFLSIILTLLSLHYF